MRDEPHEQVATDGCARSVGGGGADTADVRPPLQPAQVHPAPAVRAAGAQDAPAPGLPRHRHAAGGDAAPARRAGARRGAALHHAAEGGRAAAERRGDAAAPGRHRGHRGTLRKKSDSPVDLAAADSTGLDTTRASRYFVRRRANFSKEPQLISYGTYPKLEMICDCADHLILNAFATRGPSVDVDTLRRLMFAALRRAAPEVAGASARSWPTPATTASRITASRVTAAACAA